jgi:hypothetical protein
MRVDGLVVTWDKEFDARIGLYWSLTTLFDAIIAFHRAQEFELPQNE